MAVEKIYTDFDGSKVSNLINWRHNPLTTAQRTSLGLTAASIGLFVFDTDMLQGFYWGGSAWISSGGAATWGMIGGNIASQIDLQTEFATKANTSDLAAVAFSGAYGDLSGRPTLLSQFTNDVGFITGITGADVIIALGFTPVPDSRTITATGNGIQGGGDLTANRTINLDFAYLDSRYAGSGSGVLSFNSRTGVVVPLSGDYSSFYYPLVSNPSGYITASSVSSLTNKSGNISQWTNDVGYLTSVPVVSVFGRVGAVVAQSGDYDTSEVPENTNLYFTNARTIASVLTGYVSGAGTISATDSILSAIEKLNGNIAALVTGVSSFNTRTGAVTLTSGDVTTALGFTPYNATNPSNYIPLTALSATTPLFYDNTTGIFTIQKVDSTHDGYLSQGDWSTFNGKQPAGNYITALTGDITAAGPGSVAATLATVNTNTGSFGDATHVGSFTVNGKGLITAASNVAITFPVTSVFTRSGAVTAQSGDYTTAQVTESGNLYFTNARAIAATLTGYISGAGTISATDSILMAIQKLNGNISALVSGVSSVNGGTGAVTITVTGTSNRITVTGGTGLTPTIDIAATYVGQTSITTLGTIGTGTWNATKIGLLYGGTNADLSGTGGTSQVLKQISAGAAITVGQLAASDLSNGITGSGGGVVLATGPTLSNPLVGTQSASDNSTKAASTAYVTSAIATAISGVNPAIAVQAASAAVLPNSPTYNNGVSGIGATLTAGVTNTVLVVDGYTPILNDRILVKNQASAFQNGVYFVSQLAALGLAWILTRALDYDQPSDINNTGAIPVVNGTANATTSWVLTSTVNTIGTDSLTYTQFSLAPSTIQTTTLTNGHIWIGNGSNIATDNAVTGDVTIGNTGVTAIGSGKVTNAMLAGSIAASKLIGTDITTIGTITNGGLGTGAVIGGVTMTLGSDATGDIYYRNVSGVLTRLGIGSTNQVLTVISGLPSWQPASGAVSSVSNSDSSLTISPTTGAVVASLNVGHTNTFTVVQNVLLTSLGATTADGLLLENTTAAVNGTQQVSPAIHFSGQGFKSNSVSASQSADYRIFLVPVQGTVAISELLTFASSTNGSGYVSRMTLDNAGQLIVNGNIQSPNIGIGIAPASTTTLNILANTTAASQINFNPSASVNVTSPNKGDMWYNGTNLYIYNGSTNVDLIAGGSPVSNVSNSDGTLTISPTTGNVVASLALGHANTWTALQTISLTALGTSPTDGILLQNTTAATAGVTIQDAPLLHFKGNGWNPTAGASQAVEFLFQAAPVSANPIRGTLSILAALNGGGSSTIATLTTTGVFTCAALSGTSSVSTPNLQLGAGTTSTAPILWTASGASLLTSVSQGAEEVDSSGLKYYTIETTAGRGYVPSEQHFRLTSNGGTISTIANFFGTTSNITLVANAEYLIEIECYYTNTTAGTVTWTFTNSAAPTLQNIYAKFSPVGGIVAPAGSASAGYLEGNIQGNSTAAEALTTSGTLTTATTQYAYFKIRLINGTGTSLKIQATKLVGGTITPLAGSYWRCTRLPAANVGIFAA